MVNNTRSVNTPRVKKYLVENGIDLLWFEERMKKIWSLSEKEIADLVMTSGSIDMNNRMRIAVVLGVKMDAF